MTETGLRVLESSAFEPRGDSAAGVILSVPGQPHRPRQVHQHRVVPCRRAVAAVWAGLHALLERQKEAWGSVQMARSIA